MSARSGSRAAGAQEYHPWSTYLDAREEARARGDRKVGTEHLAVALLMEPEVAGALGCDPPAARAALHSLDRDALAAVGLDAALETGPPPAPTGGRAPRRPSLRTLLLRRIPLTPEAKRVLRDSSVEMRRRRPHPGPGEVMLAILQRPRPDPAAELLAELGVDPGVARARLAEAPREEHR